MGKGGTFLVCLLVLICGAPGWAGNVDTYGIGAKATALGGAFSAYADDPFAIYYNPAGLTQIARPVVSAGLHIVKPSLRAQGYRVSGLTPPLALGPRDFLDHASALVAPHFGFALPISPSLVAGVALYVPYGLDLKWGGTPSDPGAYNSYHTWYRREVVSPTLAYKATELLSLGAGVSLGRSKAGVDRLAFAPALANLQNRQIETDLEDTMNWSLNLGLLYKPVPAWSFGLAYRGNTKTRFAGTTRAVGLQEGDNLGLPGVTVQNTAVHTETQIDHPEQVQFGVRYLPRETLSLEVDLVWTRWSRIDGYRVVFDRKFLDAPLLGPNNPGASSEFFPRDWQDTKQLRIGVEWQATKMLALRGSYFYDPTPIPDPTLDLQWADADKRTFALGVGLNCGALSLDSVLQYTVTDGKAEIAGESVNLNNSYRGGGGAPQVSLRADGHVWGGGVTMNYKF